MEGLLKTGHGLLFNCYYSVFTVIDPNTYANMWVGNDIFYNILFNLGYMYNNIYKIYILAETDEEYWRKFGKYAGNTLMRFFYRKQHVRN